MLRAIHTMLPMSLFYKAQQLTSLDALQGVELLHVKLGLIKVDRTAAAGESAGQTVRIGTGGETAVWILDGVCNAVGAAAY